MRNDIGLAWGTEHGLQLAIQCVSDVCHYLVARPALETPATSPDAIELLCDRLTDTPGKTGCLPELILQKTFRRREVGGRVKRRSLCSMLPPSFLKNAKVFTVTAQHPFVRAVAMRGDRIIAIGSDADMKNFTDKNTRVIDCDGAFVCPGFNDAHLHFIPGGKKLLGLDVAGIRSKQKVLEKVAEFVQRAAPEQWIVGRGWDESLWEGATHAKGGGVLPTRQDLDSVAPHNPVVLYRADGHSLWANSLAMRFNDVTAATQPPAGGEIERDEKGEPTGVALRGSPLSLSWGEPSSSNVTSKTMSSFTCRGCISVPPNSARWSEPRTVPKPYIAHAVAEKRAVSPAHTPFPSRLWGILAPTAFLS